MIQVVAQALINGVLLGALYLAVTFGFWLVWQTNRVINVAHGELVMLGAYLTWALYSANWLAPTPAIAVVVPVMFAVGYGVERTLLRPGTAPRETTSLLITLGVSVAFQQGARIIFSPTPHAIPLPTVALWQVGSVNVAAGHAALFLIALLITAAAAIFLRTTMVGMRLRAVAQNPQAAQLIGVDIARARTLAFALGAAAAGAAGVLISQAQPIHPGIGPALMLRAFAITALVGRGNISALAVSALGLGVLESLVGVAVPRFGANVGVIAACVILVVMLVSRREISPLGPAQVAKP